MEPSSNWLGYKIFILGIGVRFPLVLQRINDDTRSDQPSVGEKFPAIWKNNQSGFCAINLFGLVAQLVRATDS